jgi:serine/threonine protein phosphatase PrpC
MPTRLSENTLKELDVICIPDDPVATAPFDVHRGRPPAPALAACTTAHFGRCKSNTTPAGRAPVSLAGKSGYVYGQDVCATEYLSPGVVLLSVCDGHGDTGQTFATAVSAYMTAEYHEILPMLLTGIREQRWDVVYTAVQGVYHNVHLRLRRDLGHSSSSHQGGTTCSQALVVRQDDGRVFVVSSNVGDSPILLVDPNTGNVMRTSESHTWDNLEEYQKYVDHCKRLGVAPCAAVYSRFNCGNGFIPDKDGAHEPIPIFAQAADTGEVGVDAANRAHLLGQLTQRGAIGGFQSQGRMVTVDSTTGEEVAAAPGFEHTNWGSTVLCGTKGGSQTSRSFGDHGEKRCTHAVETPSVNICEVRENMCVLVMSDGASDVVGYLHRFGTKVVQMWDGGRSRPEAQAVVHHLGEWILGIGRVTPSHGVDSAGCPKWDDVVVVGAVLSSS